METLYRWRVKDTDRFGKVRWRLMRTPMTEETARFWASNNDRSIERIDWPGALRYELQFEVPARSGIKTAR